MGPGDPGRQDQGGELRGTDFASPLPLAGEAGWGLSPHDQSDSRDPIPTLPRKRERVRPTRNSVYSQ